MRGVVKHAEGRIASFVGMVLLLVSATGVPATNAPRPGQSPVVQVASIPRTALAGPAPQRPPALAYIPKAPQVPVFLNPAPPVPGMQALVRGSDGNFWEEGWDGSAWNGWHSFAGPFVSAPAIASWGPGRLDIFGEGTDRQLWHAWWDIGRWGGWEPLGGVLASAPAVAAWGTQRLDVLVRGSDDQTWHKWWGQGAWGGWEPLGGVMTSAPAAASWGAGRLDVFVRGSDSGLWHRGWSGTAWGGWEPLGGYLVGDPGAASWGDGRIDIFVQGSDQTTWHKSWAGAWNGWETIGGVLTSGPGVATWGSGQLDVFVRGSDGAEWHKRWGSRGWSGWQSLGGVLSSVPGASSWMAASNVIAAVPYQQQIYELSCEEAALQMALAHQSLSSSQGRILGDLGVDGRHGYYSGSVLRWGNPYVNFVGDPNGSEVALTGYGTYHSPIARVASAYGANVLRQGQGIGASDIYRAVLQNHPVIAWVSFDWRYHPPGAWLSFDGAWVQYQGPIEHAVTVVGVNDSSVYVFNPWFGPQWISKGSFEAAYATYSSMAVVLQ